MCCPDQGISLLKSPWKKAGLDPAEARLLTLSLFMVASQLEDWGPLPKPALQQDHTPVSWLTSWRLHFPEVLFYNKGFPRWLRW